ncbi:GFA family protein [Microvirga solisilvae]|uniref:GFA family protein n=1 Tax=Microvirga solisilvae TaxID=2919498 RepID=UPI001FAF7151|nr:GFA family protein [Microvirga solisilvae]
MALHKGSCHCGKVTFEVEADLSQVIECNCSICRKKGYLLAFAPREALKVSGEENLSTYTFNTHTIRHRFCAHCGTATFGEGQPPGQQPDKPPMAAINVRCLEGVELSELKTVPFNGRDR